MQDVKCHPTNRPKLADSDGGIQAEKTVLKLSLISLTKHMRQTADSADARHRRTGKKKGGKERPPLCQENLPAQTAREIGCCHRLLPPEENAPQRKQTQQLGSEVVRGVSRFQGSGGGLCTEWQL